MALHPDDRPVTIKVFRESLFGDNPPPTPSGSTTRYTKPLPRTTIPLSQSDRVLAVIGLSLFFLAVFSSIFP